MAGVVALEKNVKHRDDTKRPSGDRIWQENSMRLGTIAVTLLTVSLCSAFAADPFVGTWKPKGEEWKTSPGAPQERKKSESLTIETTGKNAYRFTTTTLDGKATAQVLLVDGMDHESELAEGISRERFTYKMERIDERHLKQSVIHGKGPAVFDYVISPDGNMLTLARKGIGINSGRKLDELYVYIKN